MFVLRCTQKLLKRAGHISPQEAGPSTTVLGDWYANVLLVRPVHLVLCVSGNTMLPVVVAAKDARRLPERVAAAAREVLLAVGVTADDVDREFTEMQMCALAKTNSRRVLGGLNDFMFQLSHYYHAHPGLSHLEYALMLAETPTSVVERAFPASAARAAFSTRRLVERLSAA